ncbi:MAG: cobyric acid synthase, partial [Mycobacterium sp.]
NDDFRRAWLTRVAAAAGRSGFVVADTNVATRRDAQLDVIADLLASHLDVDAVLGLLDGPPPRRPHIASRLRP